MTEAAENRELIEPLRQLVASKDIPGRGFAIRPPVAFGFSARGVTIGENNTVAEWIGTVDGWHWHPAGADLPTSRYASPPRLPNPSRLMVPTRPGVVRAASRPSPHLSPAATGRRWVLPPHPLIWRLVAHRMAHRIAAKRVQRPL